MFCFEITDKDSMNEPTLNVTSTVSPAPIMGRGIDRAMTVYLPLVTLMFCAVIGGGVLLILFYCAEKRSAALEARQLAQDHANALAEITWQNTGRVGDNPNPRRVRERYRWMQEMRQTLERWMFFQPIENPFVQELNIPPRPRSPFDLPL